MTIFPAIDLRKGKCVRLLQGDPNAQTTYADDPALVAEQFAEIGAEWLHVINLDGAFGDADTSQNREALQAILDSVDIPIQVGGGVRSLDDIERLLDMGVTRVILGTMVAERPRQMPDIIARFGVEQIVMGIDARDGKLATHGWRTTTNIEAVEFGKQMRGFGVIHTVYTDINRDGAMSGINLEASKKMAQESGLQVIISGGVASLDDVRLAASAAADSNIAGLIIGRALYAATLDLADALKAANQQ